MIFTQINNKHRDLYCVGDQIGFSLVHIIKSLNNGQILINYVYIHFIIKPQFFTIFCWSADITGALLRLLTNVIFDICPPSLMSVRQLLLRPLNAAEEANS